MIDIFKVEKGQDIVFKNSNQMKAGNVVSTQMGSLVYAPDFGSDLEFYLMSEYRFQDENLKGHLLERLAYHQVRVDSIQDEIKAFEQRLTYNLGQDSDQNGLVS